MSLWGRRRRARRSKISSVETWVAQRLKVPYVKLRCARQHLCGGRAANVAPPSPRLHRGGIQPPGDRHGFEYTNHTPRRRRLFAGDGAAGGRACRRRRQLARLHLQRRGHRHLGEGAHCHAGGDPEGNAGPTGGAAEPRRHLAHCRDQHHAGRGRQRGADGRRRFLRGQCARRRHRATAHVPARTQRL
ncbi:hypothetical protein FQZ97_958630 [compost metagenome]